VRVRRSDETRFANISVGGVYSNSNSPAARTAAVVITAQPVLGLSLNNCPAAG
jgi:hypothetical protein